MTKSPLPDSGDKRRDGSKITKTRTIAAIGFFIALLLLLIINLSRTQVQETGISKESEQKKETFNSGSIRKSSARSAEESSKPVTTRYPTLTPQPMRLVSKVLTSKKWNDGPDAFGLDKPPVGKDGATIGPASVAYLNGNIYLLDTVNKRVLGYDQSGNAISSVALPSDVASDLAVDASGSGLVVIDHFHDKVYKVDGNEATLLAKVSIREDFPLGTKFSYDSATDSLSPLDINAMAQIDGNNLVLGLNNEDKLAISFDKPVACVEEVMTDAQGIVWLLYTLEGDYRMRRVARVDRAQKTVGVAEVDVWFPFDSTRHMVPSGNGVVIFAGDPQEGRLLSFDYSGTF